MVCKINLQVIQAQPLENQGNNFLINVFLQLCPSYHLNIDHRQIFKSFQIQKEANCIYELILKFGTKGILKQMLTELYQYFRIDKEF